MAGNDRPILVTGATGYIGGRLVPRLLAAGFRVRCMARSPRKLESRSWVQHPNVEIVEANIGDAEVVLKAAEGTQEGVETVRIVQTASFIPRGLFGLMYWYAVLPLHGFVFRGMLRGIRKTAEKDAHPTGRPSSWRDPKVHPVEPERRWRRLTPGTALRKASVAP